MTYVVLNMSKVTIYVNGEKYALDSEEITVGKLIVLGGGDPNDYELQKLKSPQGPTEITYTDPAQEIKVSDDDYFTTRFKGSINPA